MVIVKDELVTQIKDRLQESHPNASKKMINDVVSTLINVVVDNLKKGNDVFLHGLGTFKPVKKDATEKVNNLTGKKVKIPARVVLKFKPSQKVKILSLEK